MIFGRDTEKMFGVFTNTGENEIQEDCPVFVSEKGHSNIPGNCFVGLCNGKVEVGKHGLYQCYGVRELSYRHNMIDALREVMTLKDNIVFIKAL